MINSSCGAGVSPAVEKCRRVACTIKSRRRPDRRGYALVLVCIFVILFLAMLGVAWRQTASVLRIESLRAVQTRRDQGCLLAAVQGIHYLEQNISPSSPQTYTIGGRSFTVTLTQDTVDTAQWTVRAVPTATP
jgi:hypothetical protein